MVIPIAPRGQPMYLKRSEIAIIGVHDVPGAIMMINAPRETRSIIESLTPYMFAAESDITARERQNAFLFSDAPAGTAKEYSLGEIPISLQALRLSEIVALVEHVVKAVIIVIADFLNI